MTSDTHAPRLVVGDPVDASRRAAALLAAELRLSAPVLGLATGSSVELVYDELDALVSRDPALRAGAGRAHAFALDEYVGLPVGDAHTYRETLRRQVGVPLGLQHDRLHVPTVDATGGAGGYDLAIAAAGGVGVQLLGIGANGHIGFNEPGAPLSSRTRVVDLARRTREDNARFFGAVDDVPARAVTQGIATILDARTLVVLVFGEHKAEALHAALAGPVREEVPASALRLHPDVVVLADPSAAGLLGGAGCYQAAPGA